MINSIGRHLQMESMFQYPLDWYCNHLEHRKLIFAYTVYTYVPYLLLRSYCFHIFYIKIQLQVPEMTFMLVLLCFVSFRFVLFYFMTLQGLCTFFRVLKHSKILCFLLIVVYFSYLIHIFIDSCFFISFKMLIYANWFFSIFIYIRQ